MLRAASPDLTDPHRVGPPEPQVERTVDLYDIFGFLRRQWQLVAVLTLGSLALGTVYLMVTPPRYTANAVLMLDTRRLQLFKQQSVLSDESVLLSDAGAVESQLEFLRSKAIAVSVINNLQLLKDPEFTGNATGAFKSLSGNTASAVNNSELLKDAQFSSKIADFFSSISVAAQNLFGADEKEGLDPPSEDKLMTRALKRVSDNLTIERVGRSYAIAISFRSLDRAKAARIANAIGEAYILDQLQSKYMSAKQAAAWLQERIPKLRQEAIDADRLAVEFRTKNNMVDAGGRLLSDQQLTEVNTQLILARARTQEAKARLKRAQELGLRGVGDSGSVEAMQNAVLTKLQQQFVDAARREVELTARYGTEHPVVVNLRKEMETIRNISRAEVARITESLKSEYEIARGREEALQASLNKLTRDAAGTREAQVGLRVLESTAIAYRTLHDSFLQRFVEAKQQESSPSTEARLITEAESADKTHPKRLLVLVLAGVLGIGLGVGAAFAREMLDHGFHSSREVEQALGVKCVGVIPATSDKRAKGWLSRDTTADGARPLIIVAELGVMRHVVLEPHSRFTETIRSIKVTADTSSRLREIKVIGMVSAVPGEGKSTVAGNLAQLVAHSGRRGLLIDADLRKPALSRRMAPKAKAGLVEVLEGNLKLAEALWRDPVTGLNFLPTVLVKPIAHTSEVVASHQMGKLLQTARGLYDYIIVDLPPLAMVADAEAAAHHIDAFVLVIAWGETSPAAVLEALESAEVVSSKLLGAVLNRANEAKLKKLEAYKGRKYHNYYRSSRVI